MDIETRLINLRAEGLINDRQGLEIELTLEEIFLIGMAVAALYDEDDWDIDFVRATQNEVIEKLAGALSANNWSGLARVFRAEVRECKS